MFHITLDKHPQPGSLSIKERLLAIFSGADGFGQILFYWALMVSLLSLVTLIAIGFAFQSGLAILGGLIAGYCYAYLSHIGSDLIDKVSPVDD